MTERKVVALVGNKNGAPPGGGEGAPPGEGGTADWRAGIVRTREGDPRGNPHNMMLILEHDPELSGLFWLDEFGNRVVLDRAPPWVGGSRDEFTEIDAIELAAWLGSPGRYRMTVGVDMVLQCVEAIARRRKRHTVREYLEGLKWDGKPRVQRMLVDLFGAEETAYTLGVAPCMMVSAVSRILWFDKSQPEKGSKVDFMVVLEGKQGRGKTTAVLELFSASWYAEATESPAHKDFYQAMRGRWVVEIAEMESFNKADIGKIKQAITVRFDVYRPSYGRTAKSYRRECIFVGTTNTDDYLRDASGARRFLPVLVGAVDIPTIVEQRDQLWAEAVHMYREGFAWWELPPGAEREQDARYSEDVWTERILKWINGKADDRAYAHLGAMEREKDGQPLEFSVAEVLERALGLETARHDRAAATRVGQILTRLGCKKHRPVRLGQRVWAYYRERER